MTGSNNREHDSFAKKAKRWIKRIDALRGVASALGLLMKEVVGIARGIAQTFGFLAIPLAMIFPNLLPVVGHAISLLGTKIV